MHIGKQKVRTRQLWSLPRSKLDVGPSGMTLACFSPSDSFWDNGLQYEFNGFGILASQLLAALNL